MKKTESIGDFLARGGKVTTCPTKVAKGAIKKKGYVYKPEKSESEVEEKINYACLPAHIKISLGIKC